ncbi:hypothetical protein NM688_g8023 [Phlebia brevispora]|uniref:Uncharacterized protein n=1 Tax=Phlebia brevispora TaxID=194682 RepID=A0ACC1RYH3_9APHY|nr:hypothetical protein NM688_g8023 [Phlebia brevispora]
MPFARVVSEDLHEDQSVPASVAKRLTSRAGSAATVRAITVDTNFAAVDPSDKGNVTLFLQGSTGNAGNFTAVPLGDNPSKRSWWDDIVNDVLEALSFNITESDTKNFDYDKSYTLLDDSISCPAAGGFPAFTGGYTVGVEAKADITVAYGLAAVGSIIPPEIDDFGVFVNLDAQLDGILTADINANANIDSGTLTLYSLSLPGFDFAGILSLGASFDVTADASASISADISANVDLSYTISGAKLFFPPGKGSNKGIFTPATTDLQLTANPDGTASGNFGAHLTPLVQFSIDAFDGIASAGVSLNVDASASVDLSLDGNGVVGTSSSPSATYSGCADVGGELDVNFSADGSFFGLWNPSTTLTLFDKSFDIYDTNFDVTTSKLVAASKEPLHVLLRKRKILPSTSATNTTAQMSAVTPQVPMVAISWYRDGSLFCHGRQNLIDAHVVAGMRTRSAGIVPVTFFLALLMPGVALALNDWSVPCLEGQCSYDLSNGTVGGSISLSGPSSAISDITSAAGWTIIDCDPNTAAQSVRAVCTGNTTACNHLYQGGAAGTIVRLPQNCTQMAFARVADEWAHQNQSLPSDVIANTTGQNGTAAVRGMKLDTNFAAINPSQKGSISLTIEGASGSSSPAQPALTSRQYNHPIQRGLLGDLTGGLADDTSFNDTKSLQNTISIDKSFPIFSDSVSCPASGSLPAFKGSVNIDAEAKVNGVVDYGLTASGSIVPPKLDQIALFANFNATLDGILNLNATAQATFSTGKIQVFTVGLPGLDFPGIFTLGPSFNVDLEGIATIDTDVDMTVGLAYNINNGRLVFPPDQGSSSGSFVPANTNLQLSASPNVASQASVEAHVIPNIAFGINVLDGLADATVNLDLDTSAKLTLSLQAGAELSKSTNGSSSASGQFSGCVDLSSTLAINAGADGSFLDLFDDSTSVTLFSKTFDLFKKCFGSGTGYSQSQPSGYRRRRHARDIVRRGLTCPGAAVTTVASIADEAISADSIEAE